MSHGELTAPEQILDGPREVQEPQGVGHRGALLTHAVRDLALGQAEIFDEDPECLGLLDRVELLTLEVFDQRQLEQIDVGNVPDDGRDLMNPSLLRSAPAALAGHHS